MSNILRIHDEIALQSVSDTISVRDDDELRGKGARQKCELTQVKDGDAEKREPHLRVPVLQNGHTREHGWGG